MSTEQDLRAPDWDALLAQSLTRLREADSALRDALDAEERGERSLTEEERARLDAFLTGTGYLIAGRRVDPAMVLVFHREDKRS